MTCLTRNISCALNQRLDPFNSVISKGSRGPSVISSYSSVFKFGTATNLNQMFIRNFMANATASIRGDTCNQTIKCKAPLSCLAGQCILSMTRFHDAVGTGLRFDSESKKWSVVNPLGGTWTESK